MAAFAGHDGTVAAVSEEPGDANLVAVLRAAAPVDRGEEIDARAGLEDALARLVARARAAWPAVSLDEATVLAALGARLPPALEDAALDAAPVEDIALAAACAEGRAGAAAAFDAAFVDDVRAIASRVVTGAAERDEVVQRVREHLLVARAGQPPRIAEYRGRAPLRAFLRVVTTRIAIDLIRGEHGERRDDIEPAELDMADPRHDPALEMMQRRYGDVVKHAIEEGIAALEPRARTLLRHHLVDGLSIDRLAAIYDVHRATAARQLERARRDLHDHVRMALTRRLPAASDELESVVRLVRSQLDVSVRRLLASR